MFLLKSKFVIKVVGEESQAHRRVHTLYTVHRRSCSLAVFTAVSLLLRDATSFEDPLPFLSAEPLKLYRLGSRTSLYTRFQFSPEIFSFGFKSALWLGLLLTSGHSYVGPGLMSCVHLNRFFFNIVLVLHVDHPPSNRSSFPFLTAEKHPHVVTRPPPCFTVGMELARR